jgi:hypothetical protein
VSAAKTTDLKEPSPEPSMRFRRFVRPALPPLQIALILIGLWGCSLMDPDQDVPSYLIVPEVQFSPGENQGTASVNVTDLWVYSSTDVVGVFPLPAVVPVLPGDFAGGAVTLLAGIRENGISNSRAPYPFYTTLDHVPSGTAGSRDTLLPVLELVEDVRLLRVEDFENSNVFGNLAGGEGMVRTDGVEVVFEGEYSGRIEVDVDAPLARVRTVEQEYDLQGGVPAFLELDYRCNQSFAVGVYGYRNGLETKHLALVINPTEEVGAAIRWNKLYVDLGPVINAQGVADHFEVYVECILEADRESGSVGLDNLRILTY